MDNLPDDNDDHALKFLLSQVRMARGKRCGDQAVETGKGCGKLSFFLLFKWPPGQEMVAEGRKMAKKALTAVTSLKPTTSE